jgi:hypothetical protein
VLSGTNDVSAAGSTYYVLTSTNVALTLTNWVPVDTNVFAPDGGFTNSLPFSTGEPKRFYLLQLP